MAEYQDNSIGVIWKKLKKDGDVFLSIHLHGRDYVAWQVKDRRSDKSPHFRIFESEYSTKGKPVDKPKPDHDPLDDIPF